MQEIAALRAQIEDLLTRLSEAEREHAALVAAAHPSHRLGARNLLHYVTLRQHDVRRLQLGLWRHGLSSLGRLEGHVRDTLERVRDRLREMSGEPADGERGAGDAGPTWDEAERLLHMHTRALLGVRPARRHVAIMVTMPSADEVSEAWMERLLRAGTNVLRINGAHEGPEQWRRIVTIGRSVAARLEHPLRVVVDMPGPKLRTVALQEGPRVVRIRPERDELGRTIAPGRVTLHATTATLGDALAVPAQIVERLEVGDRLDLRDARGKKRKLVVVSRAAERALAEANETLYVTPETVFALVRGDEIVARFRPLEIPPRPHRITLRVDQRFALVRPGAPAPSELPAMGCSIDAALDALRTGARVLFDDGHLEAVVEETCPTHAILRVTFAPVGGLALGGEKGVNLPDTDLALPLLGADDERALEFAHEHADILGASFVRSAADVRTLHARLEALDATHGGRQRLGVLLKIETAEAFTALPAILFAALERPPVGVMIARGDLAIEAGYVRLAELQEEILWLSEAAHVPVVWATQVLDVQARTGRPTRAEVTDAAMSVRAECVMLNKGPYVVEAVEALDDILRRMEQHQYKKRSLYRKLHLALPSK